MIYGVKVILNDCNFRLNTIDRRIKERYTFQAFFTNKVRAKQCYDWQLIKFRDQQKISFGSRQLKGMIDFFIAKVNNGMIMEYGKTIISEQVKD